jgi:transposase
LANRRGRSEVLELFDDEEVRLSVEADLELVGAYDAVIGRLEWRLSKQALVHDRRTYDLLRSVPGVGEVLALVLLYEVDDVARFGSVQEFCSYARLIRPSKTSAGKPAGMPSHKKIGNAHLKWAFSEAALLLLRERPAVKAHVERLTKRHGKGKALGILSHKLGRCVYYMLKRGEYFDESAFLSGAAGPEPESSSAMALAAA